MVRVFLVTLLAPAVLLAAWWHASAYEVMRERWDHRCFTHTQDQALSDALAVWSQVSAVRDCGVSARPDIRLLPQTSYLAGDLLGAAARYNTAQGTIAYCELRIRGDQLTNKFVWVHEVGHCLGLNHSTVKGSVMWPTDDYKPVAEGFVQVNSGVLTADDVAAVQSLYDRNYRLTLGEISKQ